MRARIENRNLNGNLNLYPSADQPSVGPAGLAGRCVSDLLLLLARVRWSRRLRLIQPRDLQLKARRARCECLQRRHCALRRLHHLLHPRLQGVRHVQRLCYRVFYSTLTSTVTSIFVFAKSKLTARLFQLFAVSVNALINEATNIIKYNK